MNAAGMLFLSRKQAPRALRAKDGTFGISLLAFDRQGPHQVEAWELHWAGDAAQAWWANNSHQLQPGTPLRVQASRIRALNVAGRYTGAQIFAQVDCIELMASLDQPTKNPDPFTNPPTQSV